MFKFKDIDNKILLYLNDKDLSSCFQVNRYAYLLSKNEHFWMQLVIKKYGFHLGSCENIRQKYLNGRTWKEYYMIYIGSKYHGNVSFRCFSRNGGRYVGLYVIMDRGKILRLIHYNRNKELDGTQEEWRDEEKIESNYKSGWKNGVQKIWKNGVLISQEYYIFGLKSGTHSAWYNNGVLKYSHNFINNKPEGLIVGWFINGQMQYRRKFVKNQLVEDVKWDENGNIRLDF
jgi:hypothetical protein